MGRVSTLQRKGVGMGSSAPISERCKVGAVGTVAVLVLLTTTFPCLATEAVTRASTEDEAWRARIEVLADFAQTWIVSDREFTREPNVDLCRVPLRPPRFAKILKVGINPPSLTFDISEYYQGPSAAREASKDGKVAPPSGVYIRNRYEHKQQLEMARSSFVILQEVGFGSQQGDDVLRAGVTVVSFSEFARRFNTNEVLREYSRYWLVTDGRSVKGIMQQYFP